MLVSEMAKDIEALQTRTLALEYIIQVMIRNMSDIEKEKLISELNKVSVSYTHLTLPTILRV